MTAYRFAPGVRFRWQERTYEVRRVNAATQITVEEVFNRKQETYDAATLVSALFSGDLRFIVAGKSARKNENSANTQREYPTLADVPSHLRAIAEWRLAAIAPLLEVEPSKRTRKMVRERAEALQAEIAGHDDKSLITSVSTASLYRWIKDYTEADNNVDALIPNTRLRGGKDKTRIDPQVVALIDSTIEDKYKVRESVTVDDIVQEVAAKIEEQNKGRPLKDHLQAPSRSTIVRRIEALDIAEMFALKNGKRAARIKFKQYGAAAKPHLPLERVEIDHTRVDMMVIDDRDNLPIGRPTLTYCLDVATRYPLGYYLGFEPPSYLTVMECLYHAIRPKTDVREKYGTEHDWIAYGVPSTLVVDNGKEFIGKDLQDACLELGIVLHRTPVRTPYFKGGVERQFGTLNTMLFHSLPGTTFSNIQKRGDYDSAEQACVYLSELDKIMHTFITDIYAEDFHKGLDDIPARRWEAAADFLPGLPENIDRLNVLLGRVAERVIQHYGIEFAALLYNSSDLIHLRTRLKGEKVKIKYHPGDLSRIHVYDPFDKIYIEVPAVAEEYVQGLSLWKHRIIRNAAIKLEKSVDLAALGRAKRRIQEVIEEGRERRKIGTRSRIARWDTAGLPTHDTATAAAATSEATDAIPTPTAIQETPEASPAVPAPALTLGDVIAMLSDDGWELDYTLPKSCRDEV